VASLRTVETLTLGDLVSTPVMIVSVGAIGAGFRRLIDRAEHQERLATEAGQAAATAQERLRLARDVHDTVAKSVQGVALLASSLPRWMDRDADVARVQAGLVADSALQAVQEARDLLSGLRADPQDADLTSWLRERLDAWSSCRAAPVQVDVPPLPPVAPVACHEIRRALDEALENVDRHAPAAAVTVTATTAGGRVVVQVEDQGPGFLAARRAEAVREDRFGLVGMGERLAGVGGRAVVTSEPGRGTRVTLEVPASVLTVDLRTHERRSAGLRRGVEAPS
jgi:signal transduction histidine kinase